MRPKWTHVKFNFPRYLEIVRFSWFLHNFRVFYDRAGFSVNQKYRHFRRINQVWKSERLVVPANQTVSWVVFDKILISKIFFLRIIRLEFPKNNLSMVRVSYYCVRLKDLTPLRCHMITSTWPWDPRTMTRWSCDLIMWCSILKEVLKNWLSMRLTQVRLNYCLTSLGNK